MEGICVEILEGFSGARPKSLGDIASHWASTQPGALSVCDGRRSLSFAELDAEATSFSQALRAGGIVKGDRVLVIAEKCWEIVVVAIGIWKAGAIYVPVDTEAPEGRLEWLRDSIEPAAFAGPAARAEGLRALALGRPVFAFEDLPRDAGTAGGMEGEGPSVDGRDTAYILHTSGSTGTPKGVVMSHGAVLSYFEGHNTIFGFAPGKRCLNNAPFHFDVSIQDTFLPLTFGAAVFLTRGVPLGSVLRKQLERDRITHLIAVVTILAMMTGDGRALASMDLSALEVVMTGAETCDPRIINAWLDARPGLLVINGYGPTEVNSISLVHPIRRAEPSRSDFFPIGKPLPTVGAHLLDDEGAPIRRPGIVGELVLGGPQLMDGYWRNPDATAAAFVLVEGERCYRTGDLCVLDGEGDFHFRGRRDAEVKVAGRRIHLMEIEAALLRHVDAPHAVVGVVDYGGQKTIVGILLYEAERPRNLAAGMLGELREAIGRDLPGYMVPRFLGICDEPVLLGSGKKDGRRLLARLGEAARAAGVPFYAWTGDGFSALDAAPSRLGAAS
jgi:D-alanine--poly(phosphoribitol) ligase subunit 1